MGNLLDTTTGYCDGNLCHRRHLAGAHQRLIALAQSLRTGRWIHVLNSDDTISQKTMDTKGLQKTIGLYIC